MWSILGRSIFIAGVSVRVMNRVINRVMNRNCDTFDYILGGYVARARKIGR